MMRKTDMKDNSIPIQLAKSLRLDKNKELSLIRVCRNNDILFLGLFGSYSRGEQKEKLDSINQIEEYVNNLEFDDFIGSKLIQHGDIIWSCVRPNCESHAIIWHPHKNLIASTGFAVISPIEIPTSYIYQAITTKDFVGYLSNNARGIAYPAVTGKDFKSADILIPTYSLLEQFDEIVKSTIEQINVLKIQNKKLKEARDLLLPRLMNGEITV